MSISQERKKKEKKGGREGERAENVCNSSTYHTLLIVVTNILILLLLYDLTCKSTRYTLCPLFFYYCLFNHTELILKFENRKVTQEKPGFTIANSNAIPTRVSFVYPFRLLSHVRVDVGVFVYHKFPFLNILKHFFLLYGRRPRYYNIPTTCKLKLNVNV